MSVRLAILNICLRRFARPMIARAFDPAISRRRFARVAHIFLRPPFMLHLPGSLHRVTARPRSDVHIILYFHGGAYLTGSPQTHAALAGRLARLTGLAVFLPKYRLAPEHAAPAAFQDAIAAHTVLLAKGYAAHQIILAGDSAGGGLAFALLSHLCEAGQTPAALITFSPWTDMTLTGESLRTNARREVVLPPERLHDAVALVLGDLPANDPRISPHFAKFPKPPPVFIQVGSTEILLDDSRRMAEILQRAGGKVTLQVWPDCFHVWQILDGWLPESRQALQEVARFVDNLTPCP